MSKECSSEIVKKIAENPTADSNPVIVVAAPK